MWARVYSAPNRLTSPSIASGNYPCFESIGDMYLGFPSTRVQHLHKFTNSHYFSGSKMNNKCKSLSEIKTLIPKSEFHLIFKDYHCTKKPTETHKPIEFQQRTLNNPLSFSNCLLCPIIHQLLRNIAR